MNELTKAQEETCTYTGIFGVMLGATCFIQLIAVTRQHWLSAALMGLTALTLVAFIMLAMRNPYSVIALIISGVLIMISNVVLIIRGPVLSFVTVVYLIYIVIIITILFIGEYPQRMKAQALAKRQEENEWMGKI